MTWAGSDSEAATGCYLTGSRSVTAEINQVHMVLFRRFSTFCRASIPYSLDSAGKGSQVQ